MAVGVERQDRSVRSVARACSTPWTRITYCLLARAWLVGEANFRQDQTVLRVATC